MTAALLFLPGVVVAGFALLFATTLLERLLVPPMQPLRVPSEAGWPTAKSSSRDR